VKRFAAKPNPSWSMTVGLIGVSGWWPIYSSRGFRLTELYVYALPGRTFFYFVFLFRVSSFFVACTKRNRNKKILFFFEFFCINVGIASKLFD
jgi:hypothetical protein